MLFREIVIAGCGNPLFADDGFGPAVVEELKKLQLPDNVKVIDAGLGAPHFLFTLMEDAELPVKKLMLGHPLEKVVNRDAVANPQAIDWYVEFARQYRERTAAA